MKKIFSIAFVYLTYIVCTHAQFSNKTMNVGGTPRSYRQYLPTAFNAVSEPGLPLIVALHGIGDNMTNFSGVGFDNVADTARFIVVYPQGKLNVFNQNSWNNGTLLASNADDISFLSMLIDTMKVKYNIDFNKVYFAGFSMGGIMTYHMLCALPSRIAAIASVSGPMADSDVSGCNPGRAVPVMHMHGTSDATVPYDGTPLPSLSLVPTTMAFWQSNNGCADSTVYNLPDLAAGDGITVDTIPFNNCSAPVILWRENGAIHQWLYRPLNDVDATNEIWLFFRDKVHPGASQLGAPTETEVENISVRSIMHEIEIKSSSPIQEIGIYDVLGRKIMELNGKNQVFVTIPLGQLSTSVLLIRIMSNGRLYTSRIVDVQ